MVGPVSVVGAIATRINSHEQNGLTLNLIVFPFLSPWWELQELPKLVLFFLCMCKSVFI